ncbi:MAG: hypothetical protein IKC02_02400 [Oscillospiraceae bacterium]|nr:hypothetical protein [Oscillospiraceae bacterium]
MKIREKDLRKALRSFLMEREPTKASPNRGGGCPWGRRRGFVSSGGHILFVPAKRIWKEKQGQEGVPS